MNNKVVLRPLAAPQSAPKAQDHLRNVRLDARLHAARYVDEAVRVLVDLMRGGDSEKIRKEAATELIHMVVGRPGKVNDEPKDAKPQVLDVEDAVLEAILDDENFPESSLK